MSEHEGASGPDRPGPWEGLTAGRGNRELEVRFRTSALGLRHMAHSPVLVLGTRSRRQNLRSIYFDTPQGDLRSAGMTLRIRKRGRAAPVLTVKSLGGLEGNPFLRTEIEVRSPGLEPNLALLDKNTASELGRIAGAQPLQAQFETQIKRRTVALAWASSQIEVALDEGRIIAGERRLPLHELELELKSGYETDLLDLAMRLVEEFPLRLEFVSKGERGYRFCTGSNASPVWAASVDYQPDATFDDVVTTVMATTNAHFVANWAALRETDDPEAIHQMRVALRRLRCGLAMFKRALPCPEFEALRGEAKRIASGLGPARDCDAFREALESGALAYVERPPGCELLLQAVEEGRVAAYKDARALIEDRNTTLFVIKTQSMLAQRVWRNALSSAQLQTLAMPAREFAREALDKLYSRVLKRGQGLPDIPDQARHELRVALKNLRYGAEFFRELFDRRRRAKDYIRCIAELQDLLGAHNDAVTARAYLQDIHTSRGQKVDRAIGFILGWAARGASTADSELRSSWKKFKRTATFWK